METQTLPLFTEFIVTRFDVCSICNDMTIFRMVEIIDIPRPCWECTECGLEIVIDIETEGTK